MDGEDTYKGVDAVQTEIVTQIGSLPYDDIIQAVEYSLRHGAKVLHSRRL